MFKFQNPLVQIFGYLFLCTIQTYPGTLSLNSGGNQSHICCVLRRYADLQVSQHKVKCFLALIWKLCHGIEQSTALQTSGTRVSWEENAMASAPCPWPVPVSVVLQLYLQCKNQAVPWETCLPICKVWIILQVAWGCGFLCFCSIDIQGDCAITPYSKTGRTVLSRVIVFSKVWEQQ